MTTERSNLPPVLDPFAELEAARTGEIPETPPPAPPEPEKPAEPLPQIITAQDVENIQQGAAEAPGQFTGTIPEPTKTVRLGTTTSDPVDVSDPDIINTLGRIQKANPELYRVYAERGILAGNTALTDLQARQEQEARELQQQQFAAEESGRFLARRERERVAKVNQVNQQEVAEFLKTHTIVGATGAEERFIQTGEIPGRLSYVANTELNKIKQTNPQLAEVLVKQGFDAADKLYDKQRAEYNKNQLAISMLEKYTDDKGGVDGAKYLRENFGDTATLKNAGFDNKTIKEWQEYNEQPFVALNPVDAYWDYVNKNFTGRKPTTIAGYDPTFNAKERADWQKFTVENKGQLLKLREAVAGINKRKQSPTLSLNAFVAEYLSARGIEPNAKKTPAVTREINAAQAEYERLYGLKSTIGSGTTQLAEVLFVPAKALKPETTIKDVTPLEWGVGVAQVALLATPVLTAPLRAAGGAIGTAAKVADVGVRFATAGVFTADTVQNWNKMSAAEKTMSAAIDTVIIGSALLGIAPKVGRIKPVQSAIKYIKSVAGESRTGKPITWIAKQKNLVQAAKVAKKEKAFADAIQKDIDALKPDTRIKTTWINKYIKTVSKAKKAAQEIATQEKKQKAFEKDFERFLDSKKTRVTRAQKIRQALARADKRAAEAKKFDTKTKAIQRDIERLEKARKTKISGIEKLRRAVAKADKSRAEAKALKEQEKKLQKQLNIIQKDIDRIQKAKRKKITPLGKMRKAAARRSELAKQEKRQKAFAKAIQKDIDRIQKRKAKAAEAALPKRKYNVLQRKLREAEEARRERSKLKAFNKDYQRLLRQKQAEQKAAKAQLDRANKLIQKAKESRLKAIQQSIRQARKGQPISALDKALDDISTGIKNNDIKLLKAGARRLQIEAGKIPPQLGGKRLEDYAKNLLANPRQYLQLTKGKTAIAPKQAAGVAESVKANESFIQNAERRLKNVKDPKRKAEIEKTLKEARRQVQVATKVKTKPVIIETKPLDAPVEFPPALKGTKKTTALTVRGGKPAPKPSIKVAAKTKTVTVPVRVFKTRTITQIAQRYRVTPAEIIFAVAATDPETRQRIQQLQALNEELFEKAKEDERIQTIPVNVVDTEAIEQVKPKGVTKEKPVTTTKPEPIPETVTGKTPVPRTPVKTVTEKPVTKKPPIVLKKKKDEGKVTAAIQRGKITWYQGKRRTKEGIKELWYVIKWPYATRADAKLVTGRPSGAQVLPGRLSAYRTIQTLTGKPPNFILTLDLGVQDVLINRPTREPGKKGAIKFRLDRRQKTKGDIVLKGVR